MGMESEPSFTKLAEHSYAVRERSPVMRKLSRSRRASDAREKSDIGMSQWLLLLGGGFVG